MKRFFPCFAALMWVLVGAGDPLAAQTANQLPITQPDGSIATDDLNSVTIDVLGNDLDPDGDPLTVVAVGVPEHGQAFIRTRSNPNRTQVVYVPQRGSAGDFRFTYTVDDGRGGESGDVVTVHVTLASPFSEIIAEKGSAVPGEEAGAKFIRFGPPGLDGAEPFYRGFFRRAESARLLQGVFATVEDAPFKVVTGDDAPGLDGAKFVSFSDPVAAHGCGFLARLEGSGITNRNDDSLWSTSLPEAPGTLTLAAREGDAAPGLEGAVYESFVSFGMNSAGQLQWLAKLKLGVAGVAASDNLVLYQATESGPQLVVREGQTISAGGVTQRIKSFLFFNAPPHSNGDGRTEYIPYLLLNFADGTQAIAIYDSFTPLLIAVTTGQSPYDAPALRLGPLYSPFGGVDSDPLFRAKIRTGFAATPNGEGIFSALGQDTTRYFVTGDRLLGGIMTKFSDPVTTAGVLAFRVTLAGRGIPSNNEVLVWTPGLDQPLSYVADRGLATGGSGARIRDFRGMGLPLNANFDERRGPVYSAKLKGKGVTATNDFALYAVESSGTNTELARTGFRIPSSDAPKRLARIGAFTAVPKSPTQRRTVGLGPNVIYLATFTDDSQAIVRVQVP